MSRKRKRPGRRQRQSPAPPGPDWVNVGGRLMFVVGYTPGGAPYGIYEDEMDDDDFGDGACSWRPPA